MTSEMNYKEDLIEDIFDKKTKYPSLIKKKLT